MQSKLLTLVHSLMFYTIFFYIAPLKQPMFTLAATSSICSNHYRSKRARVSTCGGGWGGWTDNKQDFQPGDSY